MPTIPFDWITIPAGECWIGSDPTQFELAKRLESVGRHHCPLSETRWHLLHGGISSVLARF